MEREAAYTALLNNMASKYDQFDFLYREIADRLMQRLSYISLNPQWILELSCKTGFLAHQLKQQFRKAEVIGLENSFAMLATTKKKNTWRRKIHCVQANPDNLPLINNQFDLIVSNLCLPWQQSQVLFEQVFDLLAEDGLFLFTSFGPSTFFEVQANSPFTDLHLVGDALLKTGFQNPVMDRELLTVNYEKLAYLQRDIHQYGFDLLENADFELPDKISSPQPITFEIVYGHGIKAKLDLSRPLTDTVKVPVDKIKFQ
jgi:malonyl-CoA O-methyltransferase